MRVGVSPSLGEGGCQQAAALSFCCIYSRIILVRSVLVWTGMNVGQSVGRTGFADPSFGETRLRGEQSYLSPIPTIRSFSPLRNYALGSEKLTANITKFTKFANMKILSRIIFRWLSFLRHGMEFSTAHVAEFLRNSEPQNDSFGETALRAFTYLPKIFDTDRPRQYANRRSRQPRVRNHACRILFPTFALSCAREEQVMSRVILGANWVLVAAVVLSFNNFCSAETADDPFSDGKNAAKETTPHSEAARQAVSAVEQIKTVLDSPLKTPLQYDQQPLNEIINELQETYDLPILFDNAALDEVAISPDTEVSINLRNISLRSALNLMLRHPGLEDLTYVVDEEVLLITTEEKANEKLVVQVYRVDDLVNDYSQQPGGNEKNPYSSLVQAIMGCVEYDTWMANGSGEGTVQLMQPGLLVVSQTRRVHDQVQDLLVKLRDTRKAINKSTSGGGNF